MTRLMEVIVKRSLGFCPWTFLGMNLLALAVWTGGGPAQAIAQDQGRIRIKADRIHTAAGQVISPGEVLIQDGKISYVGTAIELGLPAQEVQVHTLIPGMINAFSQAGLVGGQAEVSREITPDFDTHTAIDWRSRDFVEAVDAGVTTVQILPATDAVFSGFACVVKTAGPLAARTVFDRRGVVVAISSDPTSRNRSRARPDSIYVRQPTNRMGVVWIVRNALHQVAEGNSPKGLDPDTQSVLSDILAGRTPVLSVSRADFDIRSALQLGEKFGFLPTVYGGDEVYRMIDEFKRSGATVVYTALTSQSSASGLRGREGTELRWNVPGELSKAGITFCLAGDNLLERARFAVRFGLSEQEALAAVTLEPAKILQVDDAVGSIQVGKQADLVGLSGDPMQPTSAVEWTMVAGEIHKNEGEQ